MTKVKGRKSIGKKHKQLTNKTTAKPNELSNFKHQTQNTKRETRNAKPTFGRQAQNTKHRIIS
jgi:hypothetical protein